MSTPTDEFHKERLTGIGGSDAAAALGQSPYCTAYELWARKTGRLPFAGEETERTRFGHLMENVAATEYMRRTGMKVKRVNVLRRHARYDHMIAHVDRVIVGERRGLELKNVDGFAYRNGQWGEEGSDEIPIAYMLQVCHYMSVFDFPVWDVAAVVGGNALKLYRVERDRELEEMLISAETDFWTHVVEGTPPAMDYGHPSTLDLVKRLYPGTDGTTIDLPPDYLHWHRAKADADEAVKRYQAVSDGAKAHILDAMGSAAIARLPNGAGEYTRKQVDRRPYAVEAASYIDVRYRKSKD
jgi:putative phage-type endonuclease